MTLEELWIIIKAHKDATKFKIESKSDLLDIVLAIDTEGKILYSNDSKDITLVS